MTPVYVWIVEAWRATEYLIVRCQSPRAAMQRRLTLLREGFSYVTITMEPAA